MSLQQAGELGSRNRENAAVRDASRIALPLLPRQHLGRPEYLALVPKEQGDALTLLRKLRDLHQSVLDEIDLLTFFLAPEDKGVLPHVARSAKFLEELR